MSTSCDSHTTPDTSLNKVILFSQGYYFQVAFRTETHLVIVFPLAFQLKFSRGCLTAKSVLSTTGHCFPLHHTGPSGPQSKVGEAEAPQMRESGGFLRDASWLPQETKAVRVGAASRAQWS